MISFNFDYYKATQLDEAHTMLFSLIENNQNPVYYSGGTELLTSFRKGTIKADAVIDLKNIEGITAIECIENEVTIGACVSLNNVVEVLDEMYWHDVLVNIADHTVRNAITLGGNLCGRLPYKEAILPLLALDSTAVIYNSEGLKEVALRDLYEKRLRLDKGDILYQLKFNKDHLDTYASERVTESTKTDYPLLHIFASIYNQNLFVGLSGFGNYPLYQNFDLQTATVSEIHGYFSPYAKDDSRSSKAYRSHMLMATLQTIKEELEGFDD